MNETENKYTYRGTVREIMPTKTFKSGFKTRDFACVTTGGKYENLALFTAKRDAVAKLEHLKAGDGVEVDFVLDARPWDGPQGRKWFGTNVALRIELTSGVNAGSLNLDESKLAHEPEPEIDSGELPF